MGGSGHILLFGASLTLKYYLSNKYRFNIVIENIGKIAKIKNKKNIYIKENIFLEFTIYKCN
jgi:lipid-A-disaccharide synthase-like uncharacterized protein